MILIAKTIAVVLLMFGQYWLAEVASSLHISSFVCTRGVPVRIRAGRTTAATTIQPLYQERENAATSGYKDSSGASKGIVSPLTDLVNSLSPSVNTANNNDDNKPLQETDRVPHSPQDLLQRIRDDYEVRNYLWTGDIDLDAFDQRCRFTDPTLSFTGRDTFVTNIQNLRPIVEFLTETTSEEKGGSKCRSVLLDIQLVRDCQYIQTRWNMVGDLSRLPWKPRIDVIGRTKFWYSDKNTVVFYDEEWEIPAGKALLQLITRAGTIPSSTESNSNSKRKKDVLEWKQLEEASTLKK